MTAGKFRLALFDLDHTLLPIDSDYAWGVFTADMAAGPIPTRSAKRTTSFSPLPGWNA